MNREHWKERLPWIQAWCNGETLEYRSRHGRGLWKVDDEPIFEDDEWEFRIAPKPRKVWINEFPPGDGLVAHRTKEQADACSFGRIACHEIELPPLP
jgi:hypothetical protein